MTEKELLIKVEGVSKKFCRNLKRSLWYGLRDIGGGFLGMRPSNELRKDEFWAVQNVNFELRRGECLGLIGHNGAGKSTLLKMLNGLIRPDDGKIEMHGRIGALIELGAGFNPLLTGRENVYTNGAVLGLSKEEIDEKFDEIIAFAELEEFIDTPVQNYSSGMKVRLGFAVASQMEPDILIIDEVLAVGDLGFVLKCFNRIDELLSRSAVIFVSHSMPQVSRVCSNIILLEKGRTIYEGTNISKGIDTYFSKFSDKPGGVVFDFNNSAELIEFTLGHSSTGKEGNEIFGVNRLNDLIITIVVKLVDSIPTPHILLGIYDKEKRGVGACQTENGLSARNVFKTENGFNYFKTQVTIPRINLSKGIYSISFAVYERVNSKPVLRVNNASEFQVYSEYSMWLPIEFEGIWK
jgi:lipopolysaccharide transport system ATP-binding protein